MAKGRMGLTARVAAIVSLLVAGLLGSVIVLIGVRLSSDINALVAAEGVQIAQGRAAEIGNLLDSHYWILRTLSLQDQVVSGTRTEAYDFMQKRMLKEVPADVATNLVFWPDGESRTMAGTFVNIADRGYFKAIFAEGKDYAIGDVAVSKGINEPSTILAKAVKGADGKTRAILGLEMRTAELSRIAASIKIGRTGFGWIVDQRGLIIAHPNPEAVLKLDVTNADKDGYKGLDALGKRMLTEKSGVGSYDKPDGTRYSTYFAAIPNSPGWVFGLAQDEVEIGATVRGLITLLVGILIAGIAVAVLVSYFVARSIVKPIRLVVDRVGSLAQGELGAAGADTVEFRRVRARSDELGTLGSSLESLVASLSGVASDISMASGQVSEGSGQLSQTAQGIS
ncbi:MAG TPA: methyl-accepting chemotaxis protein, partial [Spirochaetales bacterium]|nr:methyl-accepting chemotaxis protein [Spirochaetales bacterium]HRZ64021.1 methyl-accepting chemotaxis protein [Spirochaetia bacterium]